MKKQFLYPLLAILLTSCASGYENNGVLGGYSSQQTAENTYLISYQGNGYTHPDRALDLTMLRSAEICMENASPYFKVTSQKIQNIRAGLKFGLARPHVSQEILCIKDQPDSKYYISAVVQQMVRAKYKEFK